MEVNEPPLPQEAVSPSGHHAPPTDKYLAHFLSPLSIAANEANFEPFAYEFEGIDVRIGKAMADELLQLSYRQLKLCEQVMKKIKEIHLETNSEFSEFLSTPIEDFKLSTRTYHMLCGGDCVIMLDVAKLGKKGVTRLRGIGPKSLEEVRRAFIDNGCLELFDAEII